MTTRGPAEQAMWRDLGEMLAAEQEQLTAVLQRLEHGIVETNDRLGRIEERMTRLEQAAERKQSTGS